MARARKTKAKTKTASVGSVSADVSTEVETDAAAKSLDAIAALLDGDAEIQLDEPPEVSESEAIDAVAAEIDKEDAKGKAYKSSESEIEVAEDAKKAGAKRKATSSNPEAFGEMIKSYHEADPLTLDADEGVLTDKQISELIEAVPQKKVREKVLNLLGNVLKDETLSNFTVVALGVLKQGYLEGKEVTSAQIRKAYEEKGYKSGTTAAQTGQMMSMFPALKMAERKDRGTLVPNPNSVLLEALCA